MLHHFPEKLFSGYDIQRWKPDPALMFHAAKAMNVNVENCILVDDSSAGAQSGIDAGMEVFYFCADPHNKPIDHPKVTTFTDLAQLPRCGRRAGGYYALKKSVGRMADATGHNLTLSDLYPPAAYPAHRRP
jgi:beta-phosphoglucomutase-like phosphatase (HAD superfamily)